jgi:hypothetical protein
MLQAFDAVRELWTAAFGFVALDEDGALLECEVAG